MKIAVLGANGFVGSSIATFLSKQHKVVKAVRSVIDLLDPIAVKEFLSKNKFDVIINAATTMGNNNLLSDTRNNLGLFMNCYDNRHLFGKFINLGSGAEFDRTRDINLAKESDIFTVLPTDSYDFGQNMKSRISYQTENFFTIRIFNCFGLGEISTRIFPRFLKQGSLEITNDRYFDYFSIQDLLLVVDHCINNNWKVADVNAVYNEKYKISQMIEKFCNYNNLDSNYVILSTSDKNYTGDGSLLNSLSINLNGLDKGLAEYLKE